MLNKCNPLVSCLCVTRGNPEFLQRAVRCFENQTYENKELILVYDTAEKGIDNVVKSFRKKNVITINTGPHPKLSLGELRNLSIQLCSGEYFCQWDDDDWYHRDRIKVQLNLALSNFKKASLLLYWLMFDLVTENAYLSYRGPWAGSLLCRKDLIKDDFQYPKLSKSEDSDFSYKLYTLNCVYPIIMPALYVYVAHANNTWERTHFEKIFSSSLRLSKDISKVIKSILDNECSDSYACQLFAGRQFLEEIDYLFFLRSDRSLPTII